MSVNKVIILGRLGQDPEIKYTPSGAAVCNFSLATSETWNDKNSGQSCRTSGRRDPDYSRPRPSLKQARLARLPSYAYHYS